MERWQMTLLGFGLASVALRLLILNYFAPALYY
jgi:hypothetical protein